MWVKIGRKHLLMNSYEFLCVLVAIIKVYLLRQGFIMYMY